MKKILLTALLTLGLSTAVFAENPATEGASTAPVNGDYNFAIGIAEDYGMGLSMQFKKRIDVSVGHAGAGAVVIFFRFPFMKNSKFFSKRLNPTLAKTHAFPFSCCDSDTAFFV